NAPEAEVKQRAEWCLQQIAKGGSGAVPAAAARLIARRKPDGAAEVLLAYLPNADGATAAEEVRNALAAVAVRDGKADPAPDAALGESETSRRAARDAWAAWWKKNADKVDLAKLADVPRERGFTLVVQMDLPAKGKGGRVVEYDRDGKVRWQIEGLQTPRDA